jgi:hypothetical protein
MAKERFISVQFCDDLRQEIGNKISLMGCYDYSMLLESIPATLPKLCAQIKIYTPINRPFTRLSVRLMRDEDLLGEVEIPREELSTEHPNPDHLAQSKWRMITAMLVMSPFPVEKPSHLTVEADTEDGVLRGGSFWIDRAPPSPAS